MYIDSSSKFARHKFSDALFNYLSVHYTDDYSDLIIICIGTDRSTGDSLGPMVGYKLFNKLKQYSYIHIFGTLDNPVHAKNLNNNIKFIDENFKNPFIIAIDACLGSINRVGSICISNKPLRPGSGVNKVLPEVGNMSILGIVNTSGFMEYMVLQSTRLSLVMELADIISSSFLSSLWKLERKKLKAETQEF